MKEKEKTEKMSFHWNLSSDEEEGFDDWATVNLRESLTSGSITGTCHSNHHPTDRTVHGGEEESKSDDEEQEEAKPGISTIAFFSDDEEEEEGEEGEDVNWEDAEDDSDNSRKGVDSSDDAKLTADKLVASLKPVTIDFRPNDERKGKKKTDSGKKRSRKTYRFDHLPIHMQQFISQLEKAHLLCFTSHALLISKQCSEEETLHVAHSLLPSPWLNENFTLGPTEQELRNFCHWFFDFVNRTEYRRRQSYSMNHRPGISRKRARRNNGKRFRKEEDDDDEGNATTPIRGSQSQAKTIDYCSYLASTNDERPERTVSWSNRDKVQLLITIVR